MSKKKLLVTGASLGIGGVEKALLSLLNTTNFEVFDVDLLMLNPEGELMQFIDKRVNLLKEPVDFKWVIYPKGKVIQCCCRLISRPKLLFRFVKNLIWGISNRNMAQARQRLWKDVVQSLPEFPGQYDIALDFSGLMRRYVLAKVEAKEKYTWIHSDYRVMCLDKSIDSEMFKGYNGICCVSAICKEIFDTEFPAFATKSYVVHNRIDVSYILSEASKGIGFEDGFTGTRLLDVTRIDPNKGLDIAVRVCAALKRKGKKFKWYILGNDPLNYRKELEKYIKQLDVEDCFILLGFTTNPYPYLYQADVIVHFSRFEGRSVAIDEALALKKLVVLTNYPTAKDQITDGVNGYIVDFDEEKLIERIESLIDADK